MSSNTLPDFLPPTPELVSLLDSLRLALAEDLVADRDFPPFPRATRDGYAVRAEDVATVPAQLRCVGELKAGASVEQSSVTSKAGRGGRDHDGSAGSE